MSNDDRIRSSSTNVDTDIKLDDIIGSGSFGQVYKGMHVLATGSTSAHGVAPGVSAVVATLCRLWLLIRNL